MFNGCTSLTPLLEIFYWNIKKAIDISNIFKECISLEALPDILKLYITNFENMSNLFYRYINVST